MIYRINTRVVGVHPFNNILSFNYHNVRHIRDFILREKRAVHPGLWIDIGAGSSPYYALIQDVATGYLALDFNIVRRPDLRQTRADVGALPLKSDTADAALCNQVLEHVTDPSCVAHEAYRILKPGGLFLGSVPHVSPVHLEPHDFWRFTDLGLRRLLTEAGFEAVRVEGNGGVHAAAALMLGMDWILSRRQDGLPQQVSPYRILFLSPVIGLLNLLGTFLDRVLGDKKRTPANLCWIAVKPT